MKRLCAVFAGLMLLTTGIAWAGGDQMRWGQDGPRQNRQSRLTTLSASRYQSQSRNQAMQVIQQRVQERLQQSTNRRQQLRLQQQDKKQLQQRLRNRYQIQDCTGPQAKKQIRDRKKDGSCQIAADQTRTRTRTKSRAGTC